MAVPYTFGTATAAIPLSQLDSNFATAVTIGNTAVQLGNTVTTLNNLTLANVTISSGSVTITNVSVTTANVSGTANVSSLVVLTNETVLGNTAVTGNVTASINVTGAKLIPTGTSVTGNGLYLPAANALGLSTNGTNAVYIDSSQNVGIGTNSPTALLQVNSTAATVRPIVTATTGYADWVVANTGGNLYMGIDNSAGGISGTAYGRHIYSDGAYPLDFFTNATQRMRILSTGNILSLAGGSTTATGTGIAFPATQSASSDVNTLDDYEEGSWTPIVGGTATYLVQSGRYTKIGNKVFIEATLQINVIGTGNQTDIGGLPFATNSSSYPQGTISVGYISASAVSLVYIGATIGPGGTAVNLRGLTAAGSNFGALAALGSTTVIYFSGQYTV
jgi:hypothetical protein